MGSYQKIGSVRRIVPLWLFTVMAEAEIGGMPRDWKIVTAATLLSHFRNMLNQKGAIMSRKLAEISRFIGNFRYYRQSGYSFKAAWFYATLTLP